MWIISAPSRLLLCLFPLAVLRRQATIAFQRRQVGPGYFTYRRNGRRMTIYPHEPLFLKSRKSNDAFW